MASLAFSVEQTIMAPPDTVFGLFGSGPRAGWAFDAVCDRLLPGAALSLRVPLGGGCPGEVEILGRIAAVSPPHRIVVVHDVPWRGRLRFLFDAERGGTRVRIIADLDDDGLHWLLRRRGWPVPDEWSPADHRVGLLTSKSGPGSVFATATENVARLAVEELNADGGIRGRPIRLLVGDDATDAEVGAAEAARLVRAGCRAIMATTTSATFVRAAEAVRGSGVLLAHTVMNEGGLGSDVVFQFGERPQHQLAAAVAPLMREADARAWFLAGDDYCWPRIVHARGRTAIDACAGTVVGAGLVPLGTREFGPLIERIVASGAELVLSAFVGADSVAFERQCHEYGVRDRCRTLGLAMDEPTRERIGDRAAAGIWAVSGYFEEVGTEANAAFVARYRAAYGRWAPPVSSISESVYEALQLYAAAARRSADDEPSAVARELRARRAEFPRGTVTVTGPESTQQDLYVAEARPGGFRLVTTRP